MEIAIALTDGLEDYPGAIKVLDSLRERFPKSEREPDALLYLVYCYERSGNKAKAAYYKKLLDQEYADSESSKKLAQLASQSKKAPSNIDMTRRYEKIYRLFIEGQFEQALAEKREADAKYQQNYWTPQLLYIQSVYWIKERQDDSAIAVLNNIIKLYAASPLANKAKTMVDVLRRRSEIENYLNNLKVERPREEVVQTIPDEPVAPVTTPAPVSVPLPKQQADTVTQAAQPVVPTPTPVVNEPIQKAEKDTVVTLPAPEKNGAADTVSQQKPAPEKVEPQKTVTENLWLMSRSPRKNQWRRPFNNPQLPKRKSL
jgi:tetratricopeptide (TPR) repeat protein